MDIGKNNKTSHQNSYGFKTTLFPICAILSALTGALSFLSNEGIKTQTFFIILFSILLYITFIFFKKRNKYTKAQGYLFWKISAVLAISLFIYTFLRNSEDPASEENKNISNDINNSFNKNNFRDLNIYNYISPADRPKPDPLRSPSLDGMAPNISIPVRKKAAQNTRAIRIEEDPKTPIMEVPKDAGDKKTIKPVLHLPS